jgi:glutaminyl-peptide cyclotransferase
MLIAIPASALAVSSWLALIPAAGFGLVIVQRARLEDEFLKRNLAGYIDYMERVPAGLFPRLTAVRAAGLVLVGLALLVAGLVYAASANSTAGLKLSPSPFNEQRAFGDLKYVASLGPRPPGSDAHEAATTYIFFSLLAAGVDIDHVRMDIFQTSTPIGQVQMTNVIATIPGAQPDTVILGGHYDTKRMKARFVGANDGASSTAFLMEIARVLLHRQNWFTYWVVFFDSEEALKDWSPSDSLYGSRHFVHMLAQDQVKQIRAMINVHMIGDRNVHIHRDSHSSHQLTDLIFREAQELGYGRYFLERPLPVEDDDEPFVQAGIPAVDLISLDYGPFNAYWHTSFDTVGKCSPASLGIVGRVLLATLDDLETGSLTPLRVSLLVANNLRQLQRR